jgi:hypothetical protein
MKLKTTLLATAIVTALPMTFSAPVFADNSAKNDSKKVWICHRTSSEKNPWNLIEVSTSAAQAHYDHGDPVNFTIDGKNCSVSTPPPPPPPLPPDTVDVCAVSKLDGVLEQTWVVTYDRSTGLFEGSTLDLSLLEGQVVPANGLFAVGSQIQFATDSGEAGSGTAVLAQGSGVTALSRYNVTVTLNNVTLPATTLSFAGTCEELEGR